MRSLFLSRLMLTLGVVLAPVQVHAAQTYPTRPLRLIVPYAAGGNADIMGRMVAARLAEGLGQQVVVDNRGGANSIIGTELAVRAPADGHTLLVVASAIATNPALSAKMPYDALRDLAPITLVGATPIVLIAHPGLGVDSVKSLVALARARPGKINFASSGNGSPANLAGALFNVMAKVELTHVPYKATAQATSDVLAGHVELAFPSMTSVMPHVRAGRVKALAMTGEKRSPLAPDLPTVAESGVPGYQANIWNGLLAPAATPRPIIAQLNAVMVKELGSDETRARYAALGADPLASSPQQFAAFIRSEIEKWTRVAKEAGIRVDLGR